MRSSAGVSVVVDCSRRSPLRRIWRFVGYDEPNYTSTARGAELLRKLGAMSDAPYFVRCHFLLCSGDGEGRPKWGSTNAYTEDAAGNPVYSWDVLDRILDTILHAGCVPFVELGFMPEALATGPPELAYDDPDAGRWRFPPRDYGRWRDLIAALASHCVSRHGLRSVSRWYWELWNEPDIFYWQGTVQEYCRLYDFTEEGLHSALPQACLGGPATTSPGQPEAGRFLRAFLEHCVRGTNAVSGLAGTRIDFVSFHTKGGGYRVDHAAPKQTPTLCTLLAHVVAGLRIVGGFPELSGIEVNLSECDPDGWAAGTVHDNPNLFYRNTEYYASYVASAACKFLDLDRNAPNRVDGMLTWAFQFEGRPYFEGLRTLSTNGIDKPVLNVFRLLARLGSTRLELRSSHARDPLGPEGPDTAQTPTDVSGIASADQDGRIAILLAAHHDDWDAGSLLRVDLRLEGLEPGARLRIASWEIDASRANSYAEWKRLGEPQEPTPSELEAMKRAAALSPRALPTARAGPDGKASTTFTLQGHGVCLVELSPVPPRRRLLR